MREAGMSVVRGDIEVDGCGGCVYTGAGAGD